MAVKYGYQSIKACELLMLLAECEFSFTGGLKILFIYLCSYRSIKVWKVLDIPLKLASIYWKENDKEDLLFPYSIWRTKTWKILPSILTWE